MEKLSYSYSIVLFFFSNSKGSRIKRPHFIHDMCTKKRHLAKKKRLQTRYFKQMAPQNIEHFLHSFPCDNTATQCAKEGSSPACQRTTPALVFFPLLFAYQTDLEYFCESFVLFLNTFAFYNRYHVQCFKIKPFQKIMTNIGTRLSLGQKAQKSEKCHK